MQTEFLGAQPSEDILSSSLKGFARLCDKGAGAMRAAEGLLRANTSAMLAAEDCGKQFVSAVKVAGDVADAAIIASRLASWPLGALPPAAIPAAASWSSPNGQAKARPLGSAEILHAALSGQGGMERLGQILGSAATRAVMSRASTPTTAMAN